MALTVLRELGADLNRLKSDKQRRFVLEWPIDRNGTQAAIRAGYSKKIASFTAVKLLKNPIIKAIVGKMERLDLEKLELDRHEVLRQLFYMLTRSGGDLCDKTGIMIINHQVINGEVQGKTIHDLPERIKQCIDSMKQKVRRFTEEDGTAVEVVETEIKMTTKVAAVDMAMKHKGLYQAEKIDAKIVIDWDSMREPGDGQVNVIEAEIEKGSELLEQEALLLRDQT